MPRERWIGYIKDYDGGTLMECRINNKVRCQCFHSRPVFSAGSTL
jgi:hypothetical protein